MKPYKVKTVDAEEDIGQVTWPMAQHKLGRAPVLRDGRLVSIINQADLMRLLAEPDECK